MNEERPIRLQVACSHIRHKLMYVDDRHAVPGKVDDSSDTRVFWCTHTQDALGPDGEPVTPDHCRNGRDCYCHGE